MLGPPCSAQCKPHSPPLTTGLQVLPAPISSARPSSAPPERSLPLSMCPDLWLPWTGCLKGQSLGGPLSGSWRGQQATPRVPSATDFSEHELSSYCVPGTMRTRHGSPESTWRTMGKGVCLDSTAHSWRVTLESSPSFSGPTAGTKPRGCTATLPPEIPWRGHCARLPGKSTPQDVTQAMHSS